MGDNLDPVTLTFGAGQGAVANAFSGLFHTCVVGTEGDLACFGNNNFGQVCCGRGRSRTRIEFDIEFDRISSSIR